MGGIYKVSLHHPPHYFVPGTMYMVTGAILYNQPFLQEERCKELVLQTLLERAALLDWKLQAWSILNNHHHFVGQSPENGATLEKLIRQVHSITAIQLNKWAGTPGRQVWCNYWDSCLTYEQSYLARLHYVHMNPVKHGLVENAIDYPFCSYRWFIEQADDLLKAQVLAQPIDRLLVIDNF